MIEGHQRWPLIFSAFQIFSNEDASKIASKAAGGSLTVGNYCTRKNGRAYFYPRVNAYVCSGSFNFIEDLDRRLVKAGFSPSKFAARSKSRELINPNKTKRIIKPGVTWRLQFTDRSAARFLRWIYYPGNPLSMPRKAALAEKALEIFSHKDAAKKRTDKTA